MNTIDLSFDGRVATVTLDRPKAHAINTQMANELSEAFADLGASENVDGVILTGTGNIFSAGLDLIELYSHDEETLNRFWHAFGRAIVELASFPKPLIAAVNGHAPAGGCVLALCCDARIMSEGSARIGLNEVAVGVVLPTPVVELARFTVGNERAMHMILHGTLMDPEEAHGFGLVNELCPAERLPEIARKRLDKWLGLNQQAWREAKRMLKVPLIEALGGEFQDQFGATVRHWWQADTRRELGKQIEALSSKAKS